MTKLKKVTPPIPSFATDSDRAVLKQLTFLYGQEKYQNIIELERRSRAGIKSAPLLILLVLLHSLAHLTTPLPLFYMLWSVIPKM